MNVFGSLKEKLGADRVMAQKNLEQYLTLRTITIAEYFFEARSKKDLIASFSAAKLLGIPYFILGGGTNLAVTSKKITGLVVRNLFLDYYYFVRNDEYADLSVSSGYPMSLVVKRTVEDGYSGFEYQMGLPGTIGGAIYMNSKWTRPQSYVGDQLISAELLTPDEKVKKVDRDYFRFAYDYSFLQKTKEIVLSAVFRLKSHSSDELKTRSTEALEYRKKTQPFGVKSSGCFFRNVSDEEKAKHNLPTSSAGYLIDQAGLKGKRIGGFAVSDIHANFILNEGDGKQEDLVKLLSVIKRTVFEKFGIQLSPEVLVI